MSDWSCSPAEGMEGVSCPGLAKGLVWCHAPEGPVAARAAVNQAGTHRVWHDHSGGGEGRRDCSCPQGLGYGAVPIG